jgi:hypothetical protein
MKVTVPGRPGPDVEVEEGVSPSSPFQQWSSEDELSWADAPASRLKGDLVLTRRLALCSAITSSG